MFTNTHTHLETHLETHPESPVFQPDSGPSRALDRRALSHSFARAADFLNPAEKALTKAFFEDGRSASEIARLAGVTPRSILRRIDRLAARIASPRFVFVLSHRPALAQTRSRVATACILHGLSMREASRRLKLPIHSVRSHMAAVNGMFDRLSRVL